MNWSFEEKETLIKKLIKEEKEVLAILLGVELEEKGLSIKELDEYLTKHIKKSKEELKKWKKN